MTLMVIPMLMCLYVGMQSALFVPIDNDIPRYLQDWKLPLFDIIYRMLRVAWCICVFYVLQWLFFYWIAFYILARLLKKVAIYFTYRD